MGTLFSQQPREYLEVTTEDLHSFVEECRAIAAENNISFSDVIEAKKVLELARRSSLRVSDGDAKDEQLAGFGEMLQSLAESVSRIADTVESLQQKDGLPRKVPYVFPLGAK